MSQYNNVNKCQQRTVRKIVTIFMCSFQLRQQFSFERLLPSWFFCFLFFHSSISFLHRLSFSFQCKRGPCHSSVFVPNKDWSPMAVSLMVAVSLSCNPLPFPFFFAFYLLLCSFFKCLFLFLFSVRGIHATTVSWSMSSNIFRKLPTSQHFKSITKVIHRGLK